MSLLNIARRIIFWSLDFIKGSPIRNHYNEINQILGNPNSKKSTERRKELLDYILNHAVNSAPIYSTYKTFRSLQDFPVINKILIQENYNAFKSTAYLNKKQYKVSTSGSTGVPFTVYQNKNKKYRNTADTIYLFEQIGYKIGFKLYQLTNWDELNKGYLKLKFQNIIKLDISKINDNKIDSIIKILKKNKFPKYFLGIASSFESICKYLDKINSLPININAKFFIAYSDSLNDYTANAIKKYFNAPIISRYSNAEQGQIAQQKLTNDNYFYINWASYYVEILNINHDIPAKEREIGRIVITDLFNFSMPLIRYDTGDLGVFELNKFNEICLVQIEGRKMDAIYDTSGKLISAYSINPEFHKYYENIVQYQFIQIKRNEYIIKLNVLKKFEFEQDLINNFKKVLGNNAIINIEYVDEIPQLSSAKRKKVLNLYHKNIKIS
jgi:phenylacetate-CoA ligase